MFIFLNLCVSINTKLLKMFVYVWKIMLLKKHMLSCIKYIIVRINPNMVLD